MDNKKIIGGVFLGGGAGILTTLFISYTKIAELYFSGTLTALISIGIGFWFVFDKEV